MELFLGNKNEIGVEAQVTSRNQDGTLMGYAKFWIKGSFLGSCYDYIYLDGYLLGGLFQMLRVSELSDANVSLNPEDQFVYFERKANDINDNEIDSYRVSFGTLTDSFLIWAYRKNDNLVILWKFIGNRVTYEDLKDYPREAVRHVVRYDKFEEFVERLNRILNSW